MVDVRKIIAVPIALAVLYLMLNTVIFPNFKKSWQFCDTKTWYPAHGAVTTNCTSLVDTKNDTMLSGATFTEDGETWATSGVGAQNNFCLSCSTEGNYRSTNQGLQVLILVIALVGFGVGFLKYIKK